MQKLGCSTRSLALEWRCVVSFQDSDKSVTIRVGDLVSACERNDLMPIPLWRVEEIQDSIIIRDLLRGEIMLVIGYDDIKDTSYGHVKVLSGNGDVGMVYIGHLDVLCSNKQGE